MIILGVVFMVVWITGHAVWASLSFVANAMANGSGAASAESQMTLIGGMLAGQILCAGAGIPGGMAFFMRTLRARLWWIFATLFILGAAMQGWALYAFFASMP